VIFVKEMEGYQKPILNERISSELD
jgi:hypothetical protein